MGVPKRVATWIVVFIVFLVVTLGVAFVVTVGNGGLAIYLGALLAAWLLVAYVMPMLTGVMEPSEILAGIRSRRRRSTHHEGEPLPNWNDVRLDSLTKKTRR